MRRSCRILQCVCARPVKASCARRCFLVGRPAPASRKAGFSDFGFGCGGSRSIYKACASLAGPRRTLSATTSIKRTWVLSGKVSTSPTRILAEARLCFWPFIRIFPAAASLFAKVLVLKNRACQSHLSTRICVGVFDLGPWRSVIAAALQVFQHGKRRVGVSLSGRTRFLPVAP